MPPEVRKKLEEFGIEIDALKKRVAELEKCKSDPQPQPAEDRPDDPPPGDPGG